MMEAPPPYPELRILQQSENPSPFHPIPDADLTTYTHPHTLLAVRSPSSTVLHYWSPRSPSTASIAPLDSNIHTMIPINLEPSSIQLIRGFHDLGTFTLPTTDNNNDTTAISQFFSSLVGNITHDVEPSSEIITRLSAAPRHPPTDSGLSIQVFAIPVQSNTIGDLFGNGVHKLVWKWAKPDSYYEPKTGFWEVEMDRAVEDGEWRAGRNLQLLVRGVSSKEFEALKKHRVTRLA
ncbi:uncharacterized protein GGS22DRAFT_63294 [Annulohypoxylon maeteangense]|uniref:uncharacterized protein n=1 Tax=Annulohypoxylon maeteangense TaxID=1927788 RepID=UPI0020078830|nr:uncharacterized protein GGS22DRAFT_63294 [Annulohypoxylon maeteangense]KAI0888813.1 hypothetical protein GGS22DRAFT_63294 [Annulohypoxylon maeteangense]